MQHHIFFKKNIHFMDIYQLVFQLVLLFILLDDLFIY